MGGSSYDVPEAAPAPVPRKEPQRLNRFDQRSKRYKYRGYNSTIKTSPMGQEGNSLLGQGGGGDILLGGGA